MNPMLRRVAARRRHRGPRRARRRVRVDAVEQPPPPPRAARAAAADQAAGGEPARTAPKLHADLGAGYYERGQMDVALEELTEAAEARPDQPAHLQHLRPRLRDARREREGRAEFPARARARAAGLRHPAQLGLVPVQQRPAARVDPGIRARAAQSALQDAGDRAHQRRPLQRGVRRHRRRRGVLPARAGALARTTRPRCTASRCSRIEAARLDEARGCTRRLAQLPAPAPEALYLGMCVERKAGDRSRRDDRTSSQLRNRYPDSAEAKAHHHGALRVTEPHIGCR